MAVAQAFERSYWADHWLPYGAAGLVTIAAIFSAWPLYLLPSFPYLALALVVIGTPASMYLRAAGANRRLLNLGIIGVSIAFVFAMFSRMPLPSGAGGGLFSYALSIDDRVGVAYVIHVFITVAMFRSFSLLTDRDLTLTIIPAVSTILLSSVVVSGTWVIVSLLVFFLAALYLLAFEHEESWAGRAPAGRMLAHGRRHSLLAASTAATWLVLVPIIFAAAIIFGWVNLPRALLMRYGQYSEDIFTRKLLQIAAPAWIAPGDFIRLGSGLPLRNKLVFWVDSVESAAWRGATVDTYTGSGWLNSGPMRHRLPLTRDKDRWLVPAQDPGLRAGVPSRRLRQTFRLAAPMHGVIIAAYEPREIIGPLLRPRVSDTSMLTNVVAIHSGAVYTVISQRKTAPGAAVYRRGVTLSDADRERYLALPKIPDRTRRLALRITASERDDLHRALALRAYLESKYVYREHVARPPARVDHVDYFLFHMDGAYCDYFASALAVMARINGIPSRVVTGFRSDEEDEKTGWYVVREKHAHSWVEVFLDGYGWLELDPSPQLGSRPSMLEQAQKGLGSAWSAVKRAALAPLRALAATPGWWWKLPAVLLGLMLTVMGVRYLRREKPPALPRSGEGELLRQYVRRCYDRMCRWLSSWGLPKSPGATASEYALSLGQALGVHAEPMREVIRAYLMAEYSGRRPGAAEARGVAERLEAVLAMRKLLLRRWREDAKERG
jgi:transglutaminase-like putative cysteine protease